MAAPDEQQLLDTTARYVASYGAAFEETTRARLAADPRFAFLDAAAGAAYTAYRARVAMYERLNGTERPRRYYAYGAARMMPLLAAATGSGEYEEIDPAVLEAQPPLLPVSGSDLRLLESALRRVRATGGMQWPAPRHVRLTLALRRDRRAGASSVRSVTMCAASCTTTAGMWTP